ncbi:MAG: AAA family ATPase [Acidobacteriota bacterium]
MDNNTPFSARQNKSASDLSITSDKIRQHIEEFANGEGSLIETPPISRKIKPLRMTNLATVKSLPVEWLWQPLIPLGAFTLIDGEEGIGKTFINCAIACAVASGKGLPFVPESEHIQPSNVLMISSEDSFPYVIKPRLEAMNAPCERISFIDEPFVLDKTGVFQLSLAIAEFEPKLVIIDPLFSYTGKININSDNEIRSITDEIKRLAEKFHCAIVGIRHLGKSKGFGDARNAGLNGVGWRASARSHLIAGKNPNSEMQRAICQTKNNLAKNSKISVGFEIKDDNFYWMGESSLTAEIMLSSINFENAKNGGAKLEAKEFLQEMLKDSDKDVLDIITEAKLFGISESTLKRAKRELNIKAKKEGGYFGGEQKWIWSLE